MENRAEIYSNNELFGNRSRQILFIVIFSIAFLFKHISIIIVFLSAGCLKKVTGNPKFVHFVSTFQFFFFNVFLLTFDVCTDVATSLHFFSAGNPNWGLATLLPIFAPFFVMLNFTLWELYQQRSSK
jgi:hypothetical protein